MSTVKTIRVPHLGGIDAGYQMPQAYDSTKPTLVMVNSFMTSSYLYKSQFTNKALTESMNLIAIELLGHGQTRSKSEQFTYWDTAIMNLQVLEALGISGKIFVLGTSQGGWICIRMALLAPEKIAGVVPLGTSMDSESERSRRLGCWQGFDALAASISEWTSTESTPDFALTDDFCNFLVDSGFGSDVPAESRQFWNETVKSNYKGDEGRRRARMSAINLRERDGLHSRLSDVRCPVLWMHGTSDTVYSVPNAQEEIDLFVNSKQAKLQIIEGGQHFLSFSHPKEVDAAVLDFVRTYGK